MKRFSTTRAPRRSTSWMPITGSNTYAGLDQESMAAVRRPPDFTPHGARADGGEVHAEGQGRGAFGQRKTQ